MGFVANIFKTFAILRGKTSRRVYSLNPPCVLRWQVSSVHSSKFVTLGGCWMASWYFWRFKIWSTPTATRDLCLPYGVRWTPSSRGLTTAQAWCWLGLLVGNSSRNPLHANDSPRKTRVTSWTRQTVTRSTHVDEYRDSMIVRLTAPKWVTDIHNKAQPGSLNNYATNWNV